MNPIKVAGQESINRRYRDMPGIVSQKLAARGYGSSGKMGNTMFRAESERLGGLADFDAQMAELISNRQTQGAGLGASLLASGRGTASTGTATTPDTSMSNGFLSAGNGLSNLSTLLMLQKVLKPS